MAANVEIKARVRNLAALERKAAKLADRGPEILVQEDVFFNAPQARFKLRSFPEGHGELISYNRPDLYGPKRSSYSIFETADSAALHRVLTDALGIRDEDLVDGAYFDLLERFRQFPAGAGAGEISW